MPRVLYTDPYFAARAAPGVTRVADAVLCINRVFFFWICFLGLFHRSFCPIPPVGSESFPNLTGRVGSGPVGSGRFWSRGVKYHE